MSRYSIFSHEAGKHFINTIYCHFKYDGTGNCQYYNLFIHLFTSSIGGHQTTMMEVWWDVMRVFSPRSPNLCTGNEFYNDFFETTRCSLSVPVVFKGLDRKDSATPQYCRNSVGSNSFALSCNYAFSLTVHLPQNQQKKILLLDGKQLNTGMLLFQNLDPI